MINNTLPTNHGRWEVKSMKNKMFKSLNSGPIFNPEYSHLKSSPCPVTCTLPAFFRAHNQKALLVHVYLFLSGL